MKTLKKVTSHALGNIRALGEAVLAVVLYAVIWCEAYYKKEKVKLE